MPFTPSHAVVALPFVRTPLVPAAIAVGAMTPDLPLFVRGVGIRYTATHDLAWLPATVLLALLLLLVWRCVLRPAARELSPSWLADRLPASWDAGAASAWRETVSPVRRPRATGGHDRAGSLADSAHAHSKQVEDAARPSIRGILLLIASLTIGVLSHIVWDHFTHEGRWGTQLIPALAGSWGPLTGYKWLQHGSSAVGLIVLAVSGSVWLSRQRRAKVRRLLPGGIRAAWWAALPAVLVMAMVVGYLAVGPLRQGFRLEQLAYLVLPPACAVWGLATVVLAVVVQAVARSRETVR